jgi:hypothetical protein
MSRSLTPSGELRGLLLRVLLRDDLDRTVVATALERHQSGASGDAEPRSTGIAGGTAGSIAQAGPRRTAEARLTGISGGTAGSIAQAGPRRTAEARLTGISGGTAGSIAQAGPLRTAEPLFTRAAGTDRAAGPTVVWVRLEVDATATTGRVSAVAVSARTAARLAGEGFGHAIKPAARIVVGGPSGRRAAQNDERGDHC